MLVIYKYKFELRERIFINNNAMRNERWGTSEKFFSSSFSFALRAWDIVLSLEIRGSRFESKAGELASLQSIES